MTSSASDDVFLDPALTKPDRIILQNLQADIDAYNGRQAGETRAGDEKADLRSRSKPSAVGESIPPPRVL